MCFTQVGVLLVQVQRVHFIKYFDTDLQSESESEILCSWIEFATATPLSSI